MVWLPGAREEMLWLVAFPPESGTAEPKVFPSTLNWTVPVGVPAVEVVLTVALKVTGWPEAEGLAEEVRVVVVSFWNS